MRYRGKLVKFRALALLLIIPGAIIAITAAATPGAMTGNTEILFWIGAIIAAIGSFFLVKMSDDTT